VPKEASVATTHVELPISNFSDFEAINELVIVFYMSGYNIEVIFDDDRATLIMKVPTKDVIKFIEEQESFSEYWEANKKWAKYPVKS
jgi:hypothetical protein